MYCPECGNDAAEAKFCPECGANLGGVKDALSGKTTERPPRTTGQSGKKAAAQSAAAEPATSKSPSRLSPAVIWGGFGALAIIVIVIVIVASGGFGGKTGSPSASGSAAPVTAVKADTSGTYRELVDRGNKLYDQGDQQFTNQNFEQGSAYFTAAAKVYAAAWKQQPGDPGLGTDYSVALFYSGDIPGALKQVDSVIKDNPDFQKAWLNKGIFLSHEARLADQSGDKKAATPLYNEARVALTKAVALDPKSDAGKQADGSLQQLPK